MSQINLPVNDGLEYYYRLLQVSDITDDTSSFTLRPVFSKTENIRSNPWQSIAAYESDPVNYMPLSFGELNFYEPVWFQSYNTRLPRGGQDGAIWQGKGYNTALTTGFYLSYGPVHLKFRPQIGVSQNLSFDLGPYDPPQISTYYFRGEASEFAYRDFGGRIDQPVRFGPDSYSWFDLGDSSFELRFSDFSASLSNQRIWTGPGIHNSLQYGYNGPGFFHLRLGTFRPFETRIGAFEIMYVFGGIRKSDYFHEEVRNLHSVNSLAFVYSPRFAQGLSFGALRTFIHRYPKDFSEYLDQVSKIYESTVRVGLQDEENPTGHDPDNQVASIFSRWYFPDSGFELYFEYGRNDHNVDLRDFRKQPNHHRAYLLGMQKTWKIANNSLLAFGTEIMQSETPRSSLLRGNQHLGGWYVHSQQVVGFTNRGQILGTSFGPGANVQMFTSDFFNNNGLIGLTLARVVYHNSRTDQYFNRLLEANNLNVERWEIRNVEFMAGLRAILFTKYNLEIGAKIEQSWILNHHNIASNDKVNTRFEITLRKHLNGWIR